MLFNLNDMYIVYTDPSTYSDYTNILALTYSQLTQTPNMHFYKWQNWYEASQNLAGIDQARDEKFQNRMSKNLLQQRSLSEESYNTRKQQLKSQK